MGCKVANFILFQRLQLSNTPPFLGLLPLPEANADKAIERTRAFLSGRADRLPDLFGNFTYLSGWLVTHALNDNYGDDGHRVYALIEETLGISLASQGHRKELHKEFQRICDRLGLPSRGFDRMVDLYLLHAGVSKAQLPHLIAAFMRQHDLFGAPPAESTVLLNRWEDDALQFLPAGVTTLSRAILWDETAWHAGLYARIARAPEGFQPDSPFEQVFFECYRQVQAETKRTSITSVAPPRPKLHWGPDGLVLRLPRAEGRISVWLDGAVRPLRLKGGEDWLLEQPWPRSLRGAIDGVDFDLDFLRDDSRFAVFDMTIGQMLAEKPIVGGAMVELDTSDALIAARRPFSVAGEDAIALGDGCFVQRATLDMRAKDLVFGAQRLGLRPKPRRRLILRDGEIATGTKGKLFGPTAVIHVETGLGMDEIRKVRLSTGAHTWLADVKVTEGSGDLVLADCDLSGISPDPARLRLELMAPTVGSEDPRPSGIGLDAWIWPGFETTQGLAFRSSPPPGNFLNEQSVHVSAFPDGLYLDAKGGYAHATVAFGIEGEVVTFRLPWPDIIVQRHRADGSTASVPIGARIGVGSDDRFGHLSIRCPDRFASLRVGTRTEAAPFALGMTRTIAISDLMGQGRNATVVLRRSSGTEVLLFEVVDVLEPTRFEIRPGRHGLEVALALGAAIDAVGVEAEDELGQRSFHEIALGRWPSRKAPPDWLEARLCTSDARAATLTIRQAKATDGLRIGRVFVRPDSPTPNESWRPLRNARGDTFALPLTTAHSLEDAPCDQIKTRFETLSRWLSDCYAPQCWLHPGLERHLLPRWRSLGQTIAGLPLGAGLLIASSMAAPPEETSSSFVPLVHPVEIDAGLYSAVPAAFLGLADSAADGVQAVARMAALSHGGLRDGVLHAQALMAFGNSLQAQQTGEPLTGFDVAKFFKLFSFMDTNPAAGWFWHGTPLLGPDHLRSAFQQMTERMEAARVFIGDEPEAGGNSRRRDALRTLTGWVWAQTEASRRPQMPKRRIEDDRPVQADLWIAATLSEFAAASRRGAAQSHVDDLAKGLGWRTDEVLASLGFLLRLAPELFFYFLLVWQLAKVRP
ncbi:hypothetical protein [Rhodobacter capsulatus]|uniref:hypothetical protein n=1 Tax=Rhodobacter capsulatus TaxID=1061 RepID=UPI0003D2FAFE|nr:hypothetical protein [Rhodobacter capsulatus]ETD82021.1 hypothetical protein U716_10300 [Rhodobacter capsulatus B6]